MKVEYIEETTVRKALEFEIEPEVVEKEIEQRVRVDLDIMSGLAQLAERIPEFANYRPRATTAEFQRMLRRELDFGREERHMQEFALQFEHDATVKIPRSYSDLSTDRVLTMEMIPGVKLSDASKSPAIAIDAAPIPAIGTVSAPLDASISASCRSSRVAATVETKDVSGRMNSIGWTWSGWPV